MRWLLLPLVLLLAACGNTNTPAGPTTSVTCSENRVGAGDTTVNVHCDKNHDNPVDSNNPVTNAPAAQ